MGEVPLENPAGHQEPDGRGGGSDYREGPGEPPAGFV